MASFVGSARFSLRDVLNWSKNFSMPFDDVDEPLAAESSESCGLPRARCRCLKARLRRKYRVTAMMTTPSTTPAAASAMIVFELPDFKCEAVGAGLGVVVGEAASETWALAGVNGMG